MKHIKEFVKDQKNFLVALLISVLLNTMITITHENVFVVLAFRLIFIVGIALLFDSLFRFMKKK